VSRVFLLVLLAAGAPAAAGELEPVEWSKLSRRAHRLRGREGERDEKLEVLRALGREDSRRVARELAAWMVASRELEEKLTREVERARRRFKRRRPGARRRQAYHDAVRARDAERSVREEIAVLVSRLRDPDALAWLGAPGDEADRVVREARDSLRYRAAVGEALLARASLPRLRPAVLTLAADEELPHRRLEVLDWIAKHGVAEGRAVAESCLGADASAIRRGAARALRALDDPRAVPALVRALKGARGQFAHEVETILRWYTGQPFSGFGAGEQYARWWAQQGEAWLASEQGRRHAERAERRGFRARFYGVPTRSTRIVFVLDRSGSMKEPVPQYGPVSGAKRDDAVPGKTKMEVAKNQLARTIRTLNPDVKFTVVFFDHAVEAWSKAPVLRLATAETKHLAEQWFEPIGPRGATGLFAALDRALSFAKTLKARGDAGADKDGADTVFLLSDGQPTDGDVLMPPERIEKELQRFLKNNRPYRLVVHTIGVGPNHSKELMRRLAGETGGTYRAVGMPRRRK